MAVANTAWILASNSNKVLVIDWDLEAPGLHRYFHPFLIDSELTDTRGLIDYFWTYTLRLMTPLQEDESDGKWPEEASNFAEFTVRLDWKFENGGCLDFIPAGRQDADYAHRITSFNWDNFYSRLDGENLLLRIRKKLKEDYDYVLIDSRTGVSDTAGICTVAMPDRIVAMFTLNMQSINGVAAIAKSVLDQRKDNELEIFPVITRIELAEKDRLETARRRARDIFEKYVSKQKGGNRSYWKDAEILYQPYYAYEEVLATFGDETGRDYSENSLVAAMHRLAGRISGIENLSLPKIERDKREAVLLQFTKGAKSKHEDSLKEESIEDRKERADHFLKQSGANLIEHYKRQGLRSGRLQVFSTTYIILAGFVLMGLATESPFFPQAPHGTLSIAGGLFLALCKGTEMIWAKPRIAFKIAINPNHSPADVDDNLYITGGYIRRFLSTLISFIALAICLLHAWFFSSDYYLISGISFWLGFGAFFLQVMTESRKTYENWILNDWKADSLERERRLYINKIENYECEPSLAYRYFVKEVEKIMTSEPIPISNLEYLSKGISKNY
jgi:cellulose biosynthesis protein BcsQ